MKSVKVFGVGINDLKDTEYIGKCPYYDKWYTMLRRCYSPEYGSESPYSAVVVSENWLTFSNFKTWMENELSNLPCSKYDLDKDLLSGTDKIYSKDTCVLIPRNINRFIVDHTPVKPAEGNSIGLKLLDSGTWRVTITHPITKVRHQKSGFSTELEARRFWLEKKREYSEVLIEAYSGYLTTRVIDGLRNYYKEHTLVNR